MKAMKSIFKLIKITLIFLVLAVIFHNWTLKTFLALGLRFGLGAPVEIEAAHLDLFNHEITFEGILIKNPSGFPHGIMAEIPKIIGDFEASELQQGRIHLREVGVEVEDLRILRTAGGKMNLLGLKVFQTSGNKQRNEAPNVGPSRFQMDKVVLSLNRVSYTDLTGPQPLQQNFRLGIHDVVLEPPSLESIVEEIVQESVQAAGLQKILEEGIRSFGLRNWIPEKGGWKDVVAKVKQAF